MIINLPSILSTVTSFQDECLDFTVSDCYVDPSLIIWENDQVINNIDIKLCVHICCPRLELPPFASLPAITFLAVRSLDFTRIIVNCLGGQL